MNKNADEFLRRPQVKIRGVEKEVNIETEK
jgi:hypothetical protein